MPGRAAVLGRDARMECPVVNKGKEAMLEKVLLGALD